MAAAASLSSFSSLAIGSRTFSTVNYRHSVSPTVRAPTAKPSHPSLYSLHSNSTRFNPIQATPEDIDPDSAPKIDLDTNFYDSFEEAGDNITFDPPETPEVFVQSPDYEDEPIESEEEIAAAYEELYGPAYSGQSVLGNDIYVMDSKRTKSTRSKGRTEKIRDGFEEVVVQVRRVTKVVKGGKQMNFRVVVVVGDKQGKVGVGVGKATEVVTAVQKSAIDARRNIVTVRMTKYSTFPHRADGKFGAAKVMLRPAAPGTGVIAGGSVRIVLEMAGVENALGKQLGSDNALNNARATVAAVQKMRHFSEVAEDRGIPMQELWK